MPKRTSGSPPAMKRDGVYAAIYLNGKKIRLGRYGTEEANKEYRRIVGEWLAIGDAVATNKTQTYLIDELAVAFLRWAKSVYGRSDFGNYKTAIGMTLELYSGTPVKDFGIRALSTVRDSFVAKDYSRKYCNKLTGFVRKMFVWGIQYEFVTQEVAGALKLVPPVHRKQAHDNPRRKLVPVEVVKATLPYLSPMIRDMVCVQLLAIMRPSEIRRMQVGDIDKSQEIWIYRPGKHKGTWREHHKAIALGKPEQVILERRMAGKEPGRYVFTPAEAMQERWERAASKRKTPVQPSQQERKEEHAKNPKCRYREYYKAESYYNHIARAIKSANKKLPDDKQIPHWFPYKMRHTGVTELAKMEGLEVARAVVGHRLVDTTMGYNHADEAIALEAAKKRQNPLE